MICFLYIYIYYTMFRVNFNLRVSNVIHVCFGFSLIRVVIGSRKSYFLHKLIKTKTNSESLTHFALPTVFVMLSECFTGLSASFLFTCQ